MYTPATMAAVKSPQYPPGAWAAHTMPDEITRPRRPDEGVDYEWHPLIGPVSFDKDDLLRPG